MPSIKLFKENFMSGKQAKKNRKMSRIAQETIQKILPQAIAELDGNEEALEHWLTEAFYVIAFEGATEDQILPSALGYCDPRPQAIFRKA